MRSGPGAARTILLVHIISARPSKQPLMVRTFLKVYMELSSYFLFLQEQIKDIIISGPCSACSAVKFKATTSTDSCTTCPGNSSSEAGSTSLSDCRCEPGYTLSTEQVCSLKFVCSGGCRVTFKLHGWILAVCQWLQYMSNWEIQKRNHEYRHGCRKHLHHTKFGAHMQRGWLSSHIIIYGFWRSCCVWCGWKYEQFLSHKV